MSGRAGAAARTAVATAVAAAGVARAVRGAHRTGRFPGGAARWDRPNHLGRTVTLTEGPALAVGATAPLLVLDPPAACAAFGSALAGATDDFSGRADVKGLRGHLAALRTGEVTTGSLKVALLLGAGTVSVAWADRRAGRRPGHDTLAGAALVAGAANLANLFDLRPGRALKVALACALPLAVRGSAPAAAVSGAALVVLPDDLRGVSMLGDTGANPLGALVGYAAATTLRAAGRWSALAVVTGLTLASERVSFTSVIERTPGLRELDRWGRPR